MHRIHRTLASRGYELGPDGTVPPAVVLRYLEHMRWQAAGDPTLDLSKMFRDGHRVVVRAQQLELLQPIGLHEELRIFLWVARIGRASMDMRHEVRRAADDALLARAVVTVVYLNPEGRPCAIPRDYFDLLDEPADVPLVAAPPAEAAPPDASRMPLTVLPSHLDLYAHVNHSNYLSFFDDARRVALRNRAGVAKAPGAPRIRAAHLDYRREALLGDSLEIVSWEGPDASSFVFELHRQNDALILCRARIVV